MSVISECPMYGSEPHREWFQGDTLVAGINKVLLPPKPDPDHAKPWHAWCKGFTTEISWIDCDTEALAFVEVKRLLKKFNRTARER